jgi:hypothetical protein
MPSLLERREGREEREGRGRGEIGGWCGVVGVWVWVWCWVGCVGWMGGWGVWWVCGVW